jgi:dihydroorotate dehydrogenase
MISFGNRNISDIVVNSIMGHGGGGDIFPLYFFPAYLDTAHLILETETTVIAKSATRHRRRAPLLTVRKVRESGQVVGLINAYGLKNPGVEVCARMIKKAINRGFRVIPSYSPDFSQGFDTAVQQMMESLSIYRAILGADFWALEVDGSCPNAGGSPEKNEADLMRLLYLPRRVFDICISFKYGPTNSPEFLLELEAGYLADVFNGTNTFRHKLFFPNSNRQSPLAKYGGGAYSGSIIFDSAFAINKQLRKQLRRPMIMGGGISSIDQVLEYRHMLGSRLAADQNSLSICSIIRTDPPEADRIIRAGEILLEKK